MPYDIELLRILLLYLDGRQVSPRATVILDLRQEAAELSCDTQRIEEGLDQLLDLEYIEGPGADASGTWLFRRLTRKGVEFVKAAEDPAAWERMKRDRELRVRRAAEP